MNKSFSDYESDVVSFSRIPTENKKTSDIGISTTEVICFDKEVQSVTTRNTEVQTSQNTALSAPQVDENALLDFMRRVAPKIEEELRKRNKFFGSEYKHSISENENEVPTRKVLELKQHKNSENGRVNHISWSCYGNKIALSVSHLKHEDWCKHTSYIIIYDCDKNEETSREAKECIEVNTCITDLKFHPFINSLLIFATEEGKIYRHNLLEKQENNSTNVVCVSNDKITQISWITLNSQLYLTAASADGLLGLWMSSSFVENWKLVKKFTFKSMEDIKDRAISCYDFSTINSQNFVVALEGGLLVRCSTAAAFKSINNDFPNPIISEFECSSSLINCLCFSFFDENIFLTCSIDLSIRIYNLNEKSPINIISTECLPILLEWSHLQEDVFKTCTINGEIHFYNYRKTSLIKTLKTCDEIISADFKVKGMKQLFAVADLESSVCIWETSLFN